MIQIQEKNKVIFIDWVDFTRRAIMASYSTGRQFLNITCVKMIVACLNKFEVTPDDLMIIVCDNKINWRGPNVLLRPGTRDYQIDDLLVALEATSPFHIIDMKGYNGLDFASYGAKYFKDKEVIILSSDSYFEQLAIYPNVKLFSTHSKKLKIINKPTDKILKKVHKGIVNKGSKDLNLVDYQEKLRTYDITSLPKDVEAVIEAQFKVIEQGKSYSSFNFPYRSIDLNDIYDNSKKKLTTYSQSLKKKKKSKITTAQYEPLF